MSDQSSDKAGKIVTIIIIVGIVVVAYLAWVAASNARTSRDQERENRRRQRQNLHDMDAWFPAYWQERLQREIIERQQMVNAVVNPQPDQQPPSSDHLPNYQSATATATPLAQQHPIGPPNQPVQQGAGTSIRQSDIDADLGSEAHPLAHHAN